MNINPVGWFEIYVQDMDRAKRFYESVFQVKLERLDSPAEMKIELWSFPMAKDQMGASGALVKMQDGPSGGEMLCWCTLRAQTALLRQLAQHLQVEN